MNTADKLLPFAHRLADHAGAVLRRHFRTPLKADTKLDDSPVTQADREAEAVMRKLILKAHPDHGIYGEEEGRRNPNASLQWVIDPIDGTRAFMAGYPTFTTLICLAEDGVPLLSIIDQPILNERWVGMRDQPTTFNDTPVTTKSRLPLHEAVLATTSFDYFSAEQWSVFKQLDSKTKTALYGGDAYAYGMLAAGHVGCVVDVSMKPYDFFALIPIVEGAGGLITDWDGAPLTFSSGSTVLAAANESLHRAAMAIANSNG